MTTEETPTLWCKTTGKPSPTSPAPSSSPRLMGTTTTSELISTMSQGSASKPSPTSPAPSSLTRTMQTTITSELMSTMSQESASRLFPTIAAPSSSDPQSTPLNSSHTSTTYACFCSNKP